MEFLTPEIVGWIFTGLIALFVLVGYLVGLCRGWKKSGYRFLWILIIGVVLVIVTPYISRGLFDLDLTFLNLQVNGEPLTTISNAVMNALASNEQAATLIEGNPDLVPMFLKMASLMLNSILFVVLFWVLKLLTLPFFWIFSKERKKKIKENKAIKNIPALVQNKENKSVNATEFILPEQPVKKRRALGSLMGLVTGCFIAIFTMLPFIGVVNLVNDLNKIEISDGVGGQTTLVKQYVPENILDYLDGLNNSVGANVLKYTGLNFVANSTFNFLTSSTINGYTFSLVNEAETYAGLYSRIQKYLNMDFSAITQEQLDEMVVDAEYVANGLFSSGILSVVGSDLLPYFLLQFANNTEVEMSEIEEIDTALRRALEDISEVEITKYKEDLLNAVAIVKIINDEGILYKIIKGEITDPVQILDLVDEELMNELLVLSLNFNTLKTVLPIAFETALDYLSKEFDFEVDYSNVVYNDAVINNFARIFSSIYGIVLTIDFDKIETEPLDAITRQTVAKIGVVLDNIINFDYVKGTTYANATAKIKEFITDKMADLNLYSAFEDYAIEVLNGIFDNTSWTNTFIKFADIYEIGVATFKDYEENGLNYGFVVDNISTIGKVVDKIDESGIIGDVKSAAYAGIDCAKLEFISTLLAYNLTENDINDIVDYLKACINEVESWETELNLLVPLGQEIYDFITEETTDDYITRIKNTDILTSVGRKLDTYFENSKLITSTFLGTLISKAQPAILSLLPSSIDQEKAGELINVITSALNSASSWENELTNIKDMLPLITDLLEETDVFEALKTESYLTDFGTKIDLAKANNSRIFADNIMKKVIIFGLDYAESNFSTIIPTMLSDVFDLATANVANINNITWATEFSAIKNVLAFDFETVDFEAKTGFAELGELLDSVKTSQLFSNELIQDLLNTVITNMMEDTPAGMVRDAMQVVANTLETATIESWKTELSALETLLQIDFADFSLESADSLAGIGTTLDSVKTTVLLSNSNIQTIMKNILDDMIANTAAGMVKDAMQVVANTLETATITSWKTELGALGTMLQIDFAGFSMEDTTAFASIGQKFDSVKSTVLLSVTNINTILTDVFESIIDDYVTSTTDANIVNMLDDVILGISLLGNDTLMVGYATEYKDEFTSLATLLNNLTTLTTIADVSTIDATSIGAMFDNLSAKKLTATSGKHVLFMVFDMVNLSEYPNLSSIPATLKLNAQSILDDPTITTPYALMFGEVKSFAIKFDVLSGFAPGTSDISNLGTMLDDIEAMNIAGASVADMIAVEMLTTIKTSIDETYGTPLQQAARAQAKIEIQNIIDSILDETETRTYTEMFEELETLYNSL